MSAFSEDLSDLGNQSDSDNNELNQHNGSITQQTVSFNEHDIDVLYLKAIYNHKRRKKYKIVEESVPHKSTILLMNNNYEGTKENTLTVERGERVLMIHNNVKGWFWVRNERHEEGFIPAAIISYVFE